MSGVDGGAQSRPPVPGASSPDQLVGAGEASSDGPEAVLPSPDQMDEGVWQVETESSSYVFDADAGTISRWPGGAGSLHDVPILHAVLRRDGQDIRVLAATSPVIGMSWTLVLDLRRDGVSTIRQTTAVRSVVRLDHLDASVVLTPPAAATTEANASTPGGDAAGSRAWSSAMSVDRLNDESTGRWLVRTQKSIHTFDLDAGTYVRLAGPTGSSFSIDGHVARLTRVVRWPQVGHTFFIWVDDPRAPDLIEHWHQSSVIVSIDQEPTPPAG